MCYTEQLMKTCNSCSQEKSLNEFKPYKDRKGAICHLNFCKECLNIRYRESQRLRYHAQTKTQKKKYLARNKECRKNWTTEEKVFRNLRSNYRKRGHVFELEFEDILPLPTHCPVLGIALKTNKKIAGEDSYSIDRINNTKGYVKGNIIVVSNRANKIKRDASVEELGKVYEFYKTLS